MTVALTVLLLLAVGLLLRARAHRPEPPHPATDLRLVFRDEATPQLAEAARELQRIRSRPPERRPDLRDIAAATRGGLEGVRALLDSYPPGPAGEVQPRAE